MKSEDLLAVVDFIYYGEANVFQDNLENFMNIAEELKLKGLQREAHFDKGSVLDNPENVQQNYIKRRKHFKIKPEQQSKVESATSLDKCFVKEEDLSKRTVAISNQSLSGNFQDLDYQIKSIMTLGKMNGKKTNYSCNVCGKEGVYGHIKNHIEVNHIEGVSIPCNLCDKQFRSRPALKKHNLDHHNMKLVN